LVLIDHEVLGKPKNKSEVIETLKKLSGKSHRVVTALAMLSEEYGKRLSLTESTVYFRDLTDEEVLAYAKTEEPYDKAGSYALQGLGSLFIEKVEGSYTNVVGLPVETLLRELEALTQIPIFDWFKK